MGADQFARLKRFSELLVSAEPKLHVYIYIRDQEILCGHLIDREEIDPTSIEPSPRGIP